MNTNYNDTTTANNNNQPMSRSRHNLTKHRVFYLIKCLSYSTLFSITTATNNNSTIGLQQQQFILAHESSILHLTKTIETQLDKYCFSFFSFSALLQRVQIFISPLFSSFSIFAPLYRICLLNVHSTHDAILVYVSLLHFCFNSFIN